MSAKPMDALFTAAKRSLNLSQRRLLAARLLADVELTDQWVRVFQATDRGESVPDGTAARQALLNLRGDVYATHLQDDVVDALAYAVAHRND